jgi:hypothetical protein
MRRSSREGWTQAKSSRCSTASRRGCPDKLFREVLKLTENFVLRRHVCRERANETEALFARLSVIEPAAPFDATREACRALCPSDDKLREEFAGTSFPSNLIERARYCLERIEAARHGAHDELQVLGAADVHVEHIIPQKIKTKKAKEEFGDWVRHLGDKAESQHPKYVARIGNLTLFAGALNISASNNPFGMKEQACKDSGILLAKMRASMQHFKFKNVDQRSALLAAKAVELWPIPQARWRGRRRGRGGGALFVNPRQQWIDGRLGSDDREHVTPARDGPARPAGFHREPQSVDAAGVFF